jgi:hypothetical protein
MDHTKAISDHSPERYLLREMSPVEAEEFERHYFECEECALAVESGEVFIANIRALLVDADSDANEKAAREAPRISLLASWTTWWTNPAFALAAVATLVLGALSLYQGAVQIPRLRHGLEEARVLPAFQLLATSRGEAPQVTVGPGIPSFSISADIPPDVHFSRYICDLSLSGRTLFSLPVPAPAVGQPITILVPTKGLHPGTYELAIYGADADGGKRDRVSTFAFTLEFH